MNVPLLQSAVGVVVGQISAATQIECLSPESAAQLGEAVETISREWPDPDAYRRRALFLARSVVDCGILSAPFQTPKSAPQIVEEAENLGRYLDRICK